ncbi:MAG: choice-of-anchor Q domain-containing protein [Acidobacteriota bacterium]
MPRLRTRAHCALLTLLILSFALLGQHFSSAKSVRATQAKPAQALQQLVAPTRKAAPNAPTATITVNSLADGAPTNDGQCTLREALINANFNNQSGSTDCAAGSGADTITFSALFNTPQTITLTTGEMGIIEGVTITGPGANLLTVRRADNAPDFRIFLIQQGIPNVAFSGMTISNGRTPNNSNGGGIRSQSNLTLTNVHVTGNQAGESGGGVYLEFAAGVFTGCTFSGNTATFGGGGIYYQGFGTTLRLINSTVSGNRASVGGGIENLSSVGSNSGVEVVNSTITNNTADNGGGILTFGASRTATTTLRNTIIANNTPNNLATGTNGGTPIITSQGFNLTNDNSLQTLEFLNQPTDFVNTNPLLGPLQNNGGPTPTHALLFGSRALDAGHSSNAATDQRGLPRRFDIPTINNEPDSDGADIGAYEAQAAPVQPPPPTLAINDVSKNEGNSGTTAFDFTVTLSPASAQTVTVAYISGGGTATAGSDYVPVEGLLTFAPGQTTRTITVQVNGDTTVEPDETFFVNLRSPTNATIADEQGHGTIVNDDTPSLIVQNINDSGTNSLRQVIADAPAGSTVMFSPTVFNVTRTITLTSDQLLINKNLTINGPGANLLTISGNNNNRVLRVQGSGLNVTINDLTISNGRATSSIGGGILSNSSLTLNRCVIANNLATASGGGVHLQAGATGTFTACTFSGNTASTGGGLYFESAGSQRLTLTNCTLSGNTGTTTGGALVYAALSGNSPAEIVNCTIANNNSADGGGIFIYATGAGTTATVTTRNSIYANNTNTNLRTLSESGGTATITSLEYNLTTGSGSGLLTATGDQINTNPLLGPLANNGGPTPTHALLFGSPAIDKGSSSSVATDQRGVRRPVDDPLLANAAGGDGADIGAFERTAPAVVSAASFKGSPFAQESIVALFGENLTGGIAVASTVPLPTILDSTSIMVSDSTNTGRTAPLFFVSPGQINFQIPPGTAVGAATVSVVRNGNVIASTSVTIATVEPSLFTTNASGTGTPAAVLFRVRNGVVTNEAVTSAAIDMGPDGDVLVLVLYGGGIRKRSSLAAVTMKIGGVNVGADFAGEAPGFIGLDQINTAALPRSLAGKGVVNLELTVDGKPANVVTLNFK